MVDNKVVRTLSSNCQPDENGEVLRRQKDGSRTRVTCPVAIAKYNQFMGGVDRNDQTRQYYHVRLKGRKYYKYIVLVCIWGQHSKCICIIHPIWHFYRTRPWNKKYNGFSAEIGKGTNWWLQLPQKDRVLKPVLFQKTCPSITSHESWRDQQRREWVHVGIVQRGGIHHAEGRRCGIAVIASFTFAWLGLMTAATASFCTTEILCRHM